MITVGGGSVASPALTRAIRAFGEEAKKQLDETGSLAGFESKFTDDSGSDGSVTITVSAMGAAAYGAQYGQDDTILAYTLTTAQPDGGGGTATSLSSGSSEVIHGDQDIDTFTARFQDSTDQIHFGGFIYGTPEELAAAGMGPLPQPDDPDFAQPAADAAADKAASTPSSDLFAKLQQRQTVSQQLIDFLQNLLDGSRGSKHGRAAADGKESAGSSEANAPRTRLSQLTGTDLKT